MKWKCRNLLFKEDNLYGARKPGNEVDGVYGSPILWNSLGILWLLPYSFPLSWQALYCLQPIRMLGVESVSAGKRKRQYKNASKKETDQGRELKTDTLGY